MTTEYFFWQGARYKAIGSTTPLQAELHFATQKCDGDGDGAVAVTVVDVIVHLWSETQLTGLLLQGGDGQRFLRAI